MRSGKSRAKVFFMQKHILEIEGRNAVSVLGILPPSTILESCLTSNTIRQLNLFYPII